MTNCGHVDFIVCLKVDCANNKVTSSHAHSLRVTYSSAVSGQYLRVCALGHRAPSIHTWDTRGCRGWDMWRDFNFPWAGGSYRIPLARCCSCSFFLFGFLSDWYIKNFCNSICHLLITCPCYVPFRSRRYRSTNPTYLLTQVQYSRIFSFLTEINQTFIFICTLFVPHIPLKIYSDCLKTKYGLHPHLGHLRM